MTTSTTNLGLTTYNGTTDASTLFYDYISQLSGSTVTSNMQKIDAFAGQTSGCIININGSLVGLSASIVSLSTGGSYVGTSAQINSGSANNVLVSASGLAHSNYGKRTVVVPLNTSASLTTAESNTVRIPDELNGWILVSAIPSCTGSSTSGSVTFTIKKMGVSDRTTSASTMMSRNPQIDEGEYDGSTSSAAVISTTASSVFTGTRILVGVESGSSGSSVTFAQVSLTFQNLP